MARRENTLESKLAMAVIPLLFLLLYPLQHRIAATTESVGAQREELLVQSGPLLRKLSLGYDGLLANIYWTRAVQYYGSRVLDPKAKFELLDPLLNLTTDLDPHFMTAYQFGALFLSQDAAGASRPDLAVKLVRKGMAANPGDWRLYYNLGFIYYWSLKDYEGAAKCFWDGSRIPGAPPWMSALAAAVAAKGGSRETSRFMWSQIYESAKEPAIRDNALAHLQILRVQEDFDLLARISDAFYKRFGRYPASGRALVSAGMLALVPQDPAGYPYAFGPDGHPALDPSSPMTKLVR